MKSSLLFFVSFFSISAFAQEFCARTQSDIKTYLDKFESRIGFENAGGLFGGGVCWWHSRYQRSSAYLVKFSPDENPPTRPELLKILSSLRSMDEVVTIPGYSDFESFTKDVRPEIQAILNDWQKTDGFLNFEWIRGISGQSFLPPEQMKIRMDDVYSYFKTSPNPIWLMAQIKGITSHSLLLTSMHSNGRGYTLEVIDSNHPTETYSIDYVYGDQFLRPKYEKYTFVPYVGFQRDFKKISETLKRVCGDKNKLIDSSVILDGQIEI